MDDPMIAGLARLTAAAEAAVTALERVALALEAQVRDATPRPGDLAESIGRRVVRSYECHGSADQDRICRVCAAPLGSLHDLGCWFNQGGGR